MLVTHFVAYFEDGAVQAGYDYDDAAGAPRVLRAFCENNGTGTVRLTLKRKTDQGALHTLDCEPGFAREVTLNNTAPQRVPVDIGNPLKPQLTTYDIDVQYPLTG